MDLHHIIKNNVLIIAEIGKNFIQTEEDRSVEEYLENAKALVRAAKDAGADVVKFQTHHVEDEQMDIDVISPHFKGVDRYSWVTRNTNATPLETFWRPLKAYCDELGISFLSTPMSRGAAQKLHELGVDFWKIGSGDILDFVMLDYVAKTGKPVILSSGMSTTEELDASVDFLKRRNVPLVLLHCVSKYPCPPEELRLSTIGFLHKRYQVPVGFSDHSIGLDSAFAAVALGARVVEKHFSFSRDLWGADHKVSITPEELTELVAGVRALEKESIKKDEYLSKEVVRRGIGNDEKILQKDEEMFRQYFRKSLVAGQDIPAGTVITASMLYAMRPQEFMGGMPSEKYEEVLGKRTMYGIKKYEPIRLEKLQ